jgi:hypothetical protein
MSGQISVRPSGVFVDSDDQQTATSAAGAACSITLSPVAGTLHHLRSVTWSYSDTPSGGRLTIESPDGETQLDIDITAGGPGQIVMEPMKGSEIVVTLAGAGGAVVGKLNIAKQTLPTTVA